MPMREVEWQALMATIRDAIAEIAEGSGYGRVEIVCAAGKPREIHIDRSLRFLQDICPAEEEIPQGDMS